MKKETLLTIITMIIISLSILIPNKVKAENVYNRLKIGGQDIAMTNQLDINTSSEKTFNMDISITYDNPSEGWGMGVEANDKYDYFKSYNPNNANSPKKVMYYFYFGYCSNVGRSLTAIYNYMNNGISVNYDTGEICYTNGYSGTYYIAYVKMSPTYNKCGTQGEAQCEIRFNNTFGAKSQYTYNGYISFQAMVDISENNFTSAVDTLKILGANNTLINQNNTIINQQNQLNTNINNNTNAINNQTNEMLNADYNGNLEQPNKTEYNNVKSQYENIKTSLNNANTNAINIGIDGNSSNWIWQTITSILNTHTLVLGLFISILSIGILKQILGR